MNSQQFIYLLFFFELIASGFWYTGSAVTAMFLIAAAVAGCHIVFKRQSCQVYALSKVMAVYLLWLFVVAWLSAVPETAMMTLAALAGLPVMYLFATNAPTFSEIWKYLRIALFLLGVVLALWAILQVLYHIDNGYAEGPFEDRNLFAALMNMIWFPSAFLFLSANSSRYHLKLSALGAGLFIISTGLFATTSRGGIAIWLVLMPVLLWIAYRNHQSRKRLTLLVLIALASCLCSALLLNATIADRTFQLNQDPSTMARLLLWQSSIKMLLVNPVFGSGWGTFIHYYPAYRVPQENTTSGQLAHNDYLQFAVEGGIPASLIQICILFGLLIQLRRNLKQKAGVSAFESVALLLGVLALFIHALVNFIFYQAVMSILAGLYLARAAQLTDKTQNLQVFNTNKINPFLKYLSASLIVLMVFLPYGAHFFGQLINNHNNVKKENLVLDGFSAYKFAEFITTVQPQERISQETILQTAELALEDATFINKLGKNFYRRLLHQTMQRFDALRALNANDSGIGVRQARILIKHHLAFEGGYAYKRAHQVLNESIKANPYHVDSVIALSRLQREEGQSAAALQTIKNARVYVLTRRDSQLIYIELLRQLASPEVVTELDSIEKELRKLRLSSETARDFERNFSEIDIKLKAIANQIQFQEL